MSKKTKTIEVPGEAEVTLPPVKGYARGVKLVPGSNEVSVGYLDELLREHKGTPEDPDPRPTFNKWLRAGLIKMPTLKLDDEEEKLPPTLQDVPKLRDVARLVGKTQDVGLLRKWRERDDRGPVHALIEERLEELQPTTALPESLAELTIEKARPFIDACNDVEVLERWAESDTRTGIRKAIEERTEELLADLED